MSPYVNISVRQFQPSGALFLGMVCASACKLLLRQNTPYIVGHPLLVGPRLSPSRRYVIHLFKLHILPSHPAGVHHLPHPLERVIALDKEKEKELRQHAT